MHYFFTAQFVFLLEVLNSGGSGIHCASWSNTNCASWSNIKANVGKITVA